MKAYYFIFLFISLQSCTIFYTKQEKQLRVFDKRLAYYGYPSTFQCKEMWNQGKNEAMLRTIIASKKTSKKGKFVATYILLNFNKQILVTYHK